MGVTTTTGTANTYTAIATTTLASSASSYTFSSIPSTYTDLVLVINAAEVSGSTPNTLQVGVSGGAVDTATNYSYTIMYGYASGQGSARTTSSSNMYLGYFSDMTNTLGTNTTIVQLNNYSNTTAYKTFISRGNTATGVGGAGTCAIVGLYRGSTGAITSIQVNANVQSYMAGSTFTLYGIKAA